MKVIWSPLIVDGKDCFMGYVDFDWNINLCYFWILGQKHPILVEIEVLFHELIHWLIRSSAFSKLWDRLWKPISKLIICPPI
jgi:hypothetical protein